MIRPLKMLLAWIAAGIRRTPPKVEPEAIEAGEVEHAENEGPQRELAQDQDHCGPQARGPGSGAESQSAKREGEPRPPPRSPPIKILLGPRVDGGTAWTIKPPRPGGWSPAYGKICEEVKAGASTVELVDVDGIPVTWAVRWLRGSLVLQHGYTRIDITRRRAEVQITAMAAVVEGVRSWYLREMPRAVWWLLGADPCNWAQELEVVGEDAEELTLQALDALAPALEQRRIEQCVDAQGGIELQHGLEQTVVSGRLKVMLIVPRPGEVEGLLVGQRGANPRSFAIYEKAEERAAKRGPEDAALLERLREGGLDEEKPLLRYELRLWGPALVLEGLDARRPSSALDSELLGRLWASGLTTIRLVDPTHPASRMRDKATHPAWEELREAGGHAGPLRLTRVAAQAQVSSTVAHARERLRQAGADVETLLEGDRNPDDEEGDLAIDELEQAIRSPGWSSSRAKATARYQQLLESVRASS